MHIYLAPLIKELEQHANSTNAEWSKAYMLHQFDFWGVKAPVWRKLSKDHFKHGLPAFEEMEQIVQDCWKHPKRELKYVAIELLACYKKQWTKETIAIIEYSITQQSWWETVDHAATSLTGPYFKLFPDQMQKVTQKWNRSKNIWLQRSSLMFQKMYKDETDTVLLSKYILQLKSSNEFFVQKAIGWALREHSKTDPKWVQTFVKKASLSTLSEREALKKIVR